MRKFCFGVMFLAFAGHVFGQPSLTITATRSIPLQPDEVVFAVTVTSGLNSGLDDVVAALSGSGITAANFVSVNWSTSQQTPIFVWTFYLPAPFSRIKDTISTLTALQRTIAQNKSGLNLTFSMRGPHVSPQLQALQQCPIPDLIADARAQAQKIANSGGVMLGPILALSDGGSGQVSAAARVSVPYPANVIPTSLEGVVTFALGVFVNLPPAPPLNCTVVVKFSLLPPQ